MAKNSFGVCKSIFVLNIKLWQGQRLRRIILLHIGLLTFTFHFPQISNVVILMTFRTSGNFNDPRNHYSWLGTHPIIQNNSTSNWYWRPLLAGSQALHFARWLDLQRPQQHCRIHCQRLVCTRKDAHKLDAASQVDHLPIQGELPSSYIYLRKALCVQCRCKLQSSAT